MNLSYNLFRRPQLQNVNFAGIGLESKEGRAAALAGDVSAKEFRCLSRLLLVHGRRSRLRSSTLSFFVIHRGLIISTMQVFWTKYKNIQIENSYVTYFFRRYFLRYFIYLQYLYIKGY